MRLITILALIGLILAAFCQPAISQPKKKKTDPHDMFQNLPPIPKTGAIAATVVQGGKRTIGYVTEGGRIFIENSSGKIVMDGWMSRTGAVTLYDSITQDNFVGQVNPMGNGLLMSPTTNNTLRIEIER